MADPLKTSPGSQQAGPQSASMQPKVQHSPYATYPYATYSAPYGIDRGTCERSRLARNLGDLRSSLLGAQIGRSMDQIDQACVARILEYAPDRTAIRWYGAPKVDYGGPAFAVTPLKTFERDGQFCREYQALATINGHEEQTYAVACRMADGLWQSVS